MKLDPGIHIAMHSVLSLKPGVTRVNQTVGNRTGLTGYRSNRSGPVPVWSGMKPVQIQNLNLNSKNKKFPKKISKNTSRCDESNSVKFSQNSFI